MRLTKQHCNKTDGQPRVMQIGFALCMISILIIGMLSIASAEKRAYDKIKVISWKIKRTTWRNNGKVIVAEWESNLQLPDKWRVEGESFLTVWNGNKHIQYNKKNNTYWRKKKNTTCRMSTDNFTPATIEKQHSYSLRNIARTELRAEFDGIEYDAIELTFPPTVSNGKTVSGPVKIFIYIDPATGFTRAVKKDHWNASEDQLIEEQTWDYHYSESTLPDDLFQFTLPQDAVEEKR